MRRRGWVALWCVLGMLAVALAGCGAGPDTSGVTGGDRATPTPITPTGWKTYANTQFRFSLEYPANWFISDTSLATDYIAIYNYDPAQADDVDIVPPPPFNRIEIDAYTNPNTLTLRDFFGVFRDSDPNSPPASSQTLQDTKVGGQPALQIVQQPVEWTNGKIDYASVSYLVASGANMLLLKEEHSAEGEPSSIFAHMVASLKFS